MKYTKGKWRVEQCVDGIYNGKKCLVFCEGHEVVGVRQLGRLQVKEIEANAKLIASAPALLRSCKLALTILKEYPQESMGSSIIKEAIAKAEGSDE